MKSPMKWKRQKKSSFEELKQKEDKKVFFASDNSTKHYTNIHINGIEHNDSCDATDSVSYGGSTITSKSSSQRQRQQPDAPGWVHNTSSNTNTIDDQDNISPLNQQPQITTESKASIMRRTAVQQQPRGILRNHRHAVSGEEQGRPVATTSVPLENNMSGLSSMTSPSVQRIMPTVRILSNHDSSPEWPPVVEACTTNISSMATRSYHSSHSERFTEGVPVDLDEAYERHFEVINNNNNNNSFGNNTVVWEEVRGKESLGDTHQESDTHDQNNNWVERSTSEESPNLIFESDTSNHSSAANPYLQLSTSASADGDVFEVLSKCSSGEKINESGGDDDNDDNSMPPPGFTLPRKEIRDAIKYHDKLGKTLSRLALDPQLKCFDDEKYDGNIAVAGRMSGKNGDQHSLAWTNSTDMSTIDSSRLDGLKFADNNNYKNNNAAKDGWGFSSNQWFDNQHNFNSNMVQIEQVNSMDSSYSGISGYSSKTSTHSNRSNRSTRSIKRMEQHLSFLESHMIQQMEDNMKQNGVESFNTTPSISNNNTTHSFFPNTDDFKSPPIYTSDVLQNEDGNHKRVSLGSKEYLTPMCMESPPTTPIASLSVNDCSDTVGSGECTVSSSPGVESNGDDTAQQQDLDDALNGSDALNSSVDLSRIRNETATMMLDIKDKILADIQQTMNGEMEQHRYKLQLTVSKMSELLETSIQATVRKVETCQVDKENEHPQQSKTPTPTENTVDSRVLFRELEKSFQSMETSILNKISAQMDEKATHQRQAMEEIIEEKMSKVIAETNLEMNMAVQKVKKESERVSKLNALRERTPPPRERTPPRNKTPPRIPSRLHAPSPKSSSGKKKRNNKPEKSAIQDHSLEESFADTMRVIDEFVDDCDDIANDFDKIAYRMQDVDIPSDPDCDDDEF